ncbi:MAG: MipA/OmpV family protein [Candidatus Omnitrophica bacterium]|nr:MipA/OmpV family protein [Candidatus Omnitrophota bacterium]
MIKYIYIIIIYMAFSSFALAASGEGTFNLAGAGALVATSPYAGVSTKTQVIPFLFAEYKGFYIKGIEAGYHLIQKDPWTLSMITTPRLMGYSSQDSGALNGMEDRRMSLDGGIRADYALPGGLAVITAKALTDVLSRYDGSAYELSVSRTFKGKIFRLQPSAGVHYLDRTLVGYYYGVKDNEVRAGRDAYAPGGGVDPFANVVFTCGISQQLIVVTRVGIESLSDEIRKSPIVDKSYVMSAAAGLTYRF